MGAARTLFEISLHCHIDRPTVPVALKQFAWKLLYKLKSFQCTGIDEEGISRLDGLICDVLKQITSHL